MTKELQGAVVADFLLLQLCVTSSWSNGSKLFSFWCERKQYLSHPFCSIRLVPQLEKFFLEQIKTIFMIHRCYDERHRYDQAKVSQRRFLSLFCCAYAVLVSRHHSELWQPSQPCGCQCNLMLIGWGQLLAKKSGCIYAHPSNLGFILNSVSVCRYIWKGGHTHVGGTIDARIIMVWQLDLPSTGRRHLVKKTMNLVLGIAHAT